MPHADEGPKQFLEYDSKTFSEKGTQTSVSYRPVHLVLQILIDPLQSRITALDPKQRNKTVVPS